jgi:hypothetical protein
MDHTHQGKHAMQHPVQCHPLTWHLAVPGLPPGWHTTRPPRREGPWRLRYGWCAMKLLLLLFTVAAQSAAPIGMTW